MNKYRTIYDFAILYRFYKKVVEKNSLILIAIL